MGHEKCGKVNWCCKEKKKFNFFKKNIRSYLAVISIADILFSLTLNFVISLDNVRKTQLENFIIKFEFRKENNTHFV